MRYEHVARQPVRAALVLAAVNLCAACTTSEVVGTEVLVEVVASADVAAKLKFVRAFLYGATDTDESKATEELPMPPLSAAPPDYGENFKLLGSFGIAQGKTERFKLVIKGYESSDRNAPAVIEQKAIPGFRARTKLTVTMSLLDACYRPEIPCTDLEQTCLPYASDGGKAGRCGPLPFVGSTPDVTEDAGDRDVPGGAVMTGGNVDLDAGRAGDPSQADSSSGIPVVGPDSGDSVQVVDSGTVPDVIVSRLQGLCDGGDFTSCVDLGLIYDTGTSAVMKDSAHAAQLYSKACDGNYGRGCANLGLSYLQGEGVPQDSMRAAMLLRQACDAGYARGCTNLGTLYQDGKGVPMDLTRARELYTEACNLGEATSCSNLAYFYKHGVGVSVDLMRAAQLELQACNGGEMQGCNNLGLDYWFGDGVTQDKTRAAQLFKQACDGGETHGCQNLDLYNLR
ncbi:MAG: hypothetical protein JWN04_5225 [Myxococcaceae bacterium]|nr:hypothetical protein [Myxococcaceae bacterium]